MKPASRLFEPITLGGLTLDNRIAVSPMCQYSAEDGSANDWHLQHLGALSLSGAGLVIVEQTAVEPRGRISRGCLGLYSDANEAALARIVALCRRWGAARLGIQLAHAGRKGSAKLPWQGGGPLSADSGAWQTVAPSPVPFADPWPAPQMLDEAGLAAIRDAHVEAAKRADCLGFDLVELLGAHGFLLHSFLSPIANRRGDRYGGSLANRMRFPLAVAAALRAAWPRGKALGMRITGSDWISGGIAPEEAGIFARELREIGFDYVCVSSGGISPEARVALAPGYQVPFAAAVKRASGIAVQTVGMIVDPYQAEAIVADGHADCVALARAFLDDPRWAWHAAAALGADIVYPPQYRRAHPDQWPGAALAQRRARMADQ
ncbi:MAG TPA: NADH:flavin oxidoreductase/NADH oxidase [Stellaceae bacterium]|nr:NADH:flavin oxidoreductase/NADH oxidase [Stellaceae bacterium]